MLKKIFDKNHVSAQDLFELDYEKRRKVELKKDILSNFLAEWKCCLRCNTCTFTPAYLEPSFCRQIEKSSSMKSCLGVYDFMGNFEGKERSDNALYELVEKQAEIERRDKAKADLHNGPKVEVFGNIDTKTPGSTPSACRSWKKLGKCSLADRCSFLRPAGERGVPRGARGGGKKGDPDASADQAGAKSKEKGQGKAKAEVLFPRAGSGPRTTRSLRHEGDILLQAKRSSNCAGSM